MARPWTVNDRLLRHGHNGVFVVRDKLSSGAVILESVAGSEKHIGYPCDLRTEGFFKPSID